VLFHGDGVPVKTAEQKKMEHQIYEDKGKPIQTPYHPDISGNQGPQRSKKK